MIFVHKTYLPSFGIYLTNQHPVCIYTVLSVNEYVGDCAAYRGVVPTSGGEEVAMKVKDRGDKISETEAREIFPEIENLRLRYRR